MSNYSREEYTLEAFWNTYQDYWSTFDKYNLRNVDIKGNPYEWDSGGFKAQVPMYQDFLTIMAIHAVESVFDGNNWVEASRAEKRSWNEKETDNLWKLHDELYITVVRDYYDGELTFYEEYGNYTSVENDDSLIWNSTLKVQTRDEWIGENKNA